MPLVTTVGRRSGRLRIVIGGIYTILILGSISMIYPFWLMLATSVTGAADFAEYTLVPEYLYDHGALFSKYILDKRDLEATASLYQQPGLKSAKDIAVPSFDASSDKLAARVSDWLNFKKGLDARYTQINFKREFTPFSYKERYMEFLREKFEDDINLINNAYLETSETWYEVQPPYEDWSRHLFVADESPKLAEWVEWRRSQDDMYQGVVAAESIYHRFLKRRYGWVDEMNRDMGTSYGSFYDVRLPLEIPGDARLRKVYGEYVRTWHPLGYLRLRNAPSGLPQSIGDDVDISGFKKHVEEQAALEDLEVFSVEKMYVDFLRSKYGNIAAVNRSHGMEVSSFEEIRPPYVEDDWMEFRDKRSTLRWQYLTYNYKIVFDRVIFNGRALWNTFVLVALTVLAQLTINPLAAYALSRFRLSYANGILLFLLATMAFPAEVNMIPSFLLLKKLHLLDRYAALILPTIVSGYSIFLLKGFFDSLPDELYESARMDGCSELGMFMRITLPLSKPVMAVIGLGSFAAAYGGFMWAFLVCQDPEMWTLMVFLYQFQTEVPVFLSMASLVVAAVPTLLVFIFCQNLILRGIIVPLER